MFIEHIHKDNCSFPENNNNPILLRKEKLLPLPWQNLNYEDIKGEIWRQLPGLDDYFLISNLGRIKSLDRNIESKDGKTRFYKGRILKGVIIRYRNNTLNDYIEEIKVGLFYKGMFHSFRIARTVYNLFVEELNFKDDQLIVAHKDGNRLNNEVQNLYLQTISQKQKQIHIYNRGLKLSTYQTKEGKLKAAITRHKPVTQFDLNGNPIKTFISIQQAAKRLGIGDSSIIKATQHKTMVSAGGFLWQYGNIRHKIDATFYSNFLKKSKKIKGIPVAQINNNLEIINCFKTITEAAKKLNTHPNKITKALKDSKSLAGGFYWKLITT